MQVRQPFTGRIDGSQDYVLIGFVNIFDLDAMAGFSGCALRWLWAGHPAASKNCRCQVILVCRQLHAREAIYWRLRRVMTRRPEEFPFESEQCGNGGKVYLH